MSDLLPDKRYCTRCLTTFEADPGQCPNLSCRRKKPRSGWGRIYCEGEFFDRNYCIHRMLAVGGAGVTYMARELGPEGTEVGPKLAVKVLLAARDQGPYVRRLATEAQIIQELDHPNIVQYLGFVHRAGHSPYLITRFEAGGSILDHMRRVGTLSVKAACVIGRQICWALEKAHERGIVHRDLKPENVLLARPVEVDEEPVVRVADFGIAKVQGSLGSGITRVGAFVGTPHYAAPEQFVGGAVSEAADVYSLSALLYFTLMARHVVRFADRLDPEDSFQLLSDNLPPTVVRDQDSMTDVQRMNRVLSVSMQIDPQRRCTVTDLDAMLEAILADKDPAVPERCRSLPTGGFSFPGGSVTGVAGALAGTVSPLPTNSSVGVGPANDTKLPAKPADQPDQPDQPDQLEESGLAAIAAVGALAVGAAAVGAAAAVALASGDDGDDGDDDLPSPSETTNPTAAPAGPEAPPVDLPLRAQPTISPPPQEGETTPPNADAKSAESGGNGLLIFVALAGFLFVIAAAGGGMIFAQNPDIVRRIKVMVDEATGAGAERPMLTRGSKDPDQAKDFNAISTSVRGHQDRLQSRCAIPAGTTVKLDLVVDGDGSVSEARATSGGSQGTCAADQLRSLSLDRTGSSDVDVRLTLTW